MNQDWQGLAVAAGMCEADGVESVVYHEDGA